MCRDVVPVLAGMPTMWFQLCLLIEKSEETCEKQLQRRFTSSSFFFLIFRTQHSCQCNSEVIIPWRGVCSDAS